MVTQKRSTGVEAVAEYLYLVKSRADSVQNESLALQCVVSTSQGVSYIVKNTNVSSGVERQVLSMGVSNLDEGYSSYFSHLADFGLLAETLEASSTYEILEILRGALVYSRKACYNYTKDPLLVYEKRRFGLKQWDVSPLERVH